MYLLAVAVVLEQQWYLALVAELAVVEFLMVVVLVEETQFRVLLRVPQFLVAVLVYLVLAAVALAVTVVKEQVVQVAEQVQQDKVLLELLLVLILAVVAQEQINRVAIADHILVAQVALDMLV
jgi:hypothetical protein